RKYAKGASDILDILNAQNALADARQERVTCVAEWRSARLRLLANTGQLGKTSLGADHFMPGEFPSSAAMPGSSAN
ncbi:MAG TPA: TolC family protein, partial [Janthinobacterium sp.]|nr:TolC family protein [Janthinobacterium sp.]